MRPSPSNLPDGLPVEVFLDDFPPPMQEIAVRLRAIVWRELPGAEERLRLHWRLIGYHLPVEPPSIGRGARRGRHRTIFTAWVGPEARHVHLGFPMGVLLDDVDGVLEGRGITKLARWLTFRTVDEIDEAIAARLLRAAARAAALPRSALR